MQPQDRDNGLRRERPADVTGDEPKPSQPEGPLQDVDVRVRGPACGRLLVFAVVGAVSGFALALLGYVTCHAAAATSGSEPADLGESLGQLFLAVTPIVGAITGLLLALFWSMRPPKPPWSD